MAYVEPEKDDAFTTWLLRTMDDRKLGVDDIARGTGSIAATVRRWTRGEARPYAPKCEALAEFLNLPASDVLMAAGRIDAPAAWHLPGWEPLTHKEHDQIRSLLAAMPTGENIAEPFFTDDERQAVRALISAVPGSERILDEEERQQVRRLIRLWAHVSDAEWARIRRQARIMSAMGDLDGLSDPDSGGGI